MLKMFDALLPYFGGKRRLAPWIFKVIREYLLKDKHEEDPTFVDAFLGSAAMSLYVKSQGMKIIANDIAERSFITGKALIENNAHFFCDEELCRITATAQNNNHFIDTTFAPDVFTKRHAEFLDNAFANARTYPDKYVLIKYIFHIRPYSEFSSPNAFNRPMAEGRYDEIKDTYTRAIENNLKPCVQILIEEANKVNNGALSNACVNEIYKLDAFDFIDKVEGDILC